MNKLHDPPAGVLVILRWVSAISIISWTEYKSSTRLTNNRDFSPPLPVERWMGFQEGQREIEERLRATYQSWKAEFTPRYDVIIRPA
jgi:hypothetical protein